MVIMATCKKSQQCYNQNCSHLYVGDVISGVSNGRMPVFWRLHNVFPICHEPQQARPACRDGDASSQPVETKQKKRAKTNSRQTQPRAGGTDRRVPLNVATSPVCAFGRPFWQASVVRARVTPQLPNRKPIC